VLDSFAGSGSTLVAAAITGRRYLGIELEPKYCAVARNRLADLRTVEAGIATADLSSPPRVALGGLLQWLRERDYHDLARTVRQAMVHYPA
jgi:DNA methylase